MVTESGVYEERFLWSRRTGTVVAAGAVAVANGADLVWGPADVVGAWRAESRP